MNCHFTPVIQAAKFPSSPHKAQRSPVSSSESYNISKEAEDNIIACHKSVSQVQMAKCKMSNIHFFLSNWYSSTVYLMYNFYNFYQLAGFLEGKKAVTVRHFLKAKERDFRNISFCRSSPYRCWKTSHHTTTSTMTTFSRAYSRIGFGIILLNFWTVSLSNDVWQSSCLRILKISCHSWQGW